VRNIIWEEDGLKMTASDSIREEIFATEEEIQHEIIDSGCEILERKYVESAASQIIVTTVNDDYFFDLPVSISSSSALLLQENDLHYKGEFILYAGANGIEIVNRIEFEEYVKGVVPNEIGNGVPSEAMKAQAVAARTLVVSTLLSHRHPGEKYDLCSATHCQVYKGLYNQNYIIVGAVEDTRGMILTYEGQPAQTLYSSCCGGRTEDNFLVWKNKQLPYLQSVVDGHQSLPEMTSDLQAENWIQANTEAFCSPDDDSAGWEKAAYEWEKRVSVSDIESRCGIKGITNIKILERGKSGRVIKLSIDYKGGNLILDSELKIRQKLGGLSSSLFYIKSRNPYIFSGKGSGHGVGLCQTGAIGMSKQGLKFEDILEHYYQGTELIKFDVRLENK